MATFLHGEMGVGRRRAVSFATVLLATVVSACVTGTREQEALGDLRNPVLRVRWLPPCSMTTDVTFFSVEVYSDGLVRYTGSEQTRVKGEQTVRLPAESLRSVLRVARSTVNRSHSKVVRTGEETNGAYCLDVEIYDARGRARRGMVNSFSKEARPLISALNEVVQKEWVCPPRRAFIKSWEKDLGARDYCGGWHSRPEISFSISDTTGCLTYEAEVFRKVIYFTAVRRPGNYPDGATSWVKLEEKYYDIDDPAFQALVAVALKSKLERVEITHTDPKYPPDYITTEPDDVLRIKKTLTQSTSFNWVEMPARTAPCSKYGGLGSGHIRFEHVKNERGGR